MDGFELNKIFGAITGALVVFLGVSFVVEGMFAKGHGGHGDHHGEKLAFAIAIEDEAGHSDDAAEEEPPIDLVALVAAADVASGEKVFKKCSACHNVEPGGANGQGPALHGVMGREIGRHAGFGYSDVLSGMGGVWDWAAMDGFLTKPKEWAPGTKMNFAGLKKPEDRADLMAYLNANSGAPIDPPTE